MLILNGRNVAIVLSAFLALGSAAYAQSSHGTHMPATQSKASAPPYERAYNEAMDKMHGPMMQGIKAKSADEAFVRGMIPHHQGAIDMAKIVLQYGADDQIKAMANNIIRDQQREIAEMEDWLKKNKK